MYFFENAYPHTNSVMNQSVIQFICAGLKVVIPETPYYRDIQCISMSQNAQFLNYMYSRAKRSTELRVRPTASFSGTKQSVISMSVTKTNACYYEFKQQL